jgi:transcriptional regulator with XRE-family HTH domain
MPWMFKADMIRTTREKLGLTASRFGRLMEPRMSGAQILDIETGRRGLTVASLLRICNRYGLSPVAVFQSTGQDSPRHQTESSVPQGGSSIGPRRGDITTRGRPGMIQQVIWASNFERVATIYPNERLLRREAQAAFNSLGANDAMVDRIVADIVERLRAGSWREAIDRGNPELIPSLADYLDQRLWEDEPPIGGKVVPLRPGLVGGDPSRSTSEPLLP